MMKVTPNFFIYLQKQVVLSHSKWDYAPSNCRSPTTACQQGYCLAVVEREVSISLEKILISTNDTSYAL